MKKTKLTRSLLAACSIVALSAVMYGCSHSDSGPSQDELDAANERANTAATNLEEAQKEVELLEGKLETAGDDADEIQQQLDDAKDELTLLQGAEDAAAAMAHRAKLGKLAEAIGAPSGEDGATLADHVQTVTAKPTTATDGDAPHAISDWNGATYSDTTTAGATTMTAVYNNMEAATSVTFASRWGAADDVTPAARTGTYTFMNGANGKYVSIAGMPTHASHAGVKVGPVTPVRGTFNGVAGGFTSNTGIETLTVGVDADGVPTWTGDLNFKPNSGTSMVMMDDDNFLNLGWWLSMDADGVIDDVMVAAWATGDDYVTTGLGALIGKATFEGIAVGKYTHKTINSIYGGHFNADAMLVADFSDPMDTDDGTLTGTISGFMQDGQSIGSGWKVELGAAPANPGDPFDPMTGAVITSDGMVADTENGALGTFGNQKTMGTWNAALVDDSRIDTMPGGVTGTFHVGQESHPINMVGAFAASNQEADLPSN